MSDKPQDWDRTRDEIISGEYVLGVLSEEDRRRVEARMAGDPKFANQVRRWQANLADFNEDYRDVRPSPELYKKIETRLFGMPQQGEQGGLLQAVWSSVFLWRTLTAVAIIAGVSVTVADRVTPPVGPTVKPLVAELTAMDTPMSLIASYDTASGRLSITPAALKQEKPKSLQLWLITEDKQAHSLGILPDGTGAINVPSAMRKELGPDKTIAISVEPFGGAPDGKPTGPVIAMGKTRAL